MLGGFVVGAVLIAWVWVLLLSLPPSLIVLASGRIGDALVAGALPLVGAYYFGAGAFSAWISGRIEVVVAAGSALSTFVLIGVLSALANGELPGFVGMLIAGYLVLLAALGGFTVGLVRRRRARRGAGGSP